MPESTEPCRIVIPVYRPLSQAEYAIVVHNLDMLSGFRVTLIGPQKQAALLNRICADLAAETGADVTFELFEDAFFEGIDSYNRLMVSPQIYERFSDCTYILICQTDALILKPDLQAWLDQGFSYVGAPVFVGFAQPVQPPTFKGGLNGGLSLRHIPDTLRVFQTFQLVRRGRWVRFLEKTGLGRVRNWFRKPYLPIKDGMYEDIFWSTTVPVHDTGFTVPNPQDAARFAFETCADYLFDLTGNQLPFGCHAIDKYDPDFWRRHAGPEVSKILDLLENPPRDPAG